MKKRVIAALLASAMLICVTACKDKKTDTTLNQGAPVTYADNGVYPVQCDDTLAFWVQLNSVLSTTTDNFAKSPMGMELEKQTGIKVEYIHPAQGQQSEQFSLLIASGELPDMLQTNWLSFGAQKSIDAGYILPLNDVIEKYAPNLNKLLTENEEMSKMVKTDEGSYYVFPSWRGDSYLCSYAGPIIRKDWLDDVGLEMPETIEEWETMLRAFKDEKGAQKPLSFNNTYFQYGFLTGAFGVTQGFFIGNDGKVKFGPIEEGFKDFLTVMNRWYQDGLLDSDIASSPKTEPLILADKTGATMGFVGGGIGSWLENKRSTGDEKFEVVGAPYPVLNKGDKPMFAYKDWQYGPSASVAITSQCKNVELAARYLDYGYSAEGSLLYNYGIEGESYTMQNGKAIFTDLIMNNPEGYTTDNMVARYAMSGSSGPFVMERNAVEQTRPYPQQAEAIEVWDNTDASAHLMPLLTFTSEESRTNGNIMSEINTYVSTNMYSFINGQKSLDEYDEFVEQIKRFGIDKVIEVYEAALARYNSR